MPPYHISPHSASQPAETNPSRFVKLSVKTIIHAQRHMPNQDKAFPRGSLNTKGDWKKFVTQLNWVLYIPSISGSVYIRLPFIQFVSLFFASVPLCLAFLCSVNCKPFLNATVSGISSKLNLAHIVLICIVCFIEQEITLDVQIIYTSQPKCQTTTLEEAEAQNITK